MISKNKGQIILSGFILLMSIFFLGWCLRINRSGMEEVTPYHAKFVSVDGLHPGANIFLKGVNVGRVRDISLNHLQDEADVTFVLKASLSLPVDSRLILSRTMTGEGSLSIFPGKSKSYFKPGDRMTHISVSPSLEQTISNYAFGSNLGH